MRTIKFRGKTIGDDSRWVYGSLVQYEPGEWNICVLNPNNRPPHNYILPVNPDTVGQFTGMTDMDGVEIYEGDILNVHNFYFDGQGEAEAETNGILKWGELGWHLCSVTGWIARHMGYDESDPSAETELASLIPARFMDAKDADDGLLLDKWGLHEESYTVLGNIYDNPATDHNQDKEQ